MIRISRVRFVPAARADVRRGLLGYVSFLLDGSVHVGGVTLRRARGGGLRLSFPARRDRRGDEHPYLRPIDRTARKAIEMAVFAALGLTSEGAR